MKTFYLKPTISAPTTEKLIYVAQNGQGYFANNELHIANSDSQFIYKFKGENIGWYMRNQYTRTDYYLGYGASPTILLDNIDVKDIAYWESITYSPEQEVENIDTPQENQEE